MKFPFIHTLIFACFFLVAGIGQSQTDRKVAILDMTAYNGETGSSRLLSVVRVMRLMGVPHEITTDLSAAIQYPIIITGSRINSGAFDAGEITQLENYVTAGGVLINSYLGETNLFNLCGINAITSSNLLYEIEWDTTVNTVFDYVNDSMETTISLGRITDGPTFTTKYYALNGAISIGNYENGESALTHNQFGSGHVYTFGPDFRDVLLRNQLNFDSNAQRIYSNGFEPTADIIMIILRNIVRKHLGNTVYKYTQPYKYTSSIMITHDIDSQTGMDTMLNFSDYQISQGFYAHYNITTRYFADSAMSAFYLTSWAEVNEVKTTGHYISSHSVGHFPDFADETTFPMGTSGNTTTSYTPFYDLIETDGGTVMGELEVSKNILESDHNVQIRSFRAGHLAVNDSLMLALQLNDYHFDSSSPANDLLSSFPFYGMEVRSFSSTESSVLEIPMTISDVFPVTPINATNYPSKVALWTDVTWRYDANHSPVVILIHPNRIYKLTAMQNYISQLPSGALLYPFEEYGDFWRKRDSLVYTTAIVNDTMTVTIDVSLLTLEQSFVIDFAGLDTVQFEDLSGNPLEFQWSDWDFGSRIYFQEEIMTDAIDENDFNVAELTVYPNPTNSLFTVSVENDPNAFVIYLYDLTGRLIWQSKSETGVVQISVDELNLNSGTYILVAETSAGNLKTKLAVIR